MSDETRPPVWPPGFLINPRATVLADDLIDAFRSIPVSVAGDCMGRSTGALGLRPYHGDIRVRLCGPAVTVRVRPGDNLMIHKAMLLAHPGDVLVIDGGGDLTQALLGGLMRTTALRLRLGGFVVDGAIRDIVEWADGGMPIFAMGHTHRGPSKEGPGQINVPVSCARLVVQAGDLVLGDADGVIAIPAADARALIDRARAHLAWEASIRASNTSGADGSSRVDAMLRSKGLPI